MIHCLFVTLKRSITVQRDGDGFLIGLAEITHVQKQLARERFSRDQLQQLFRADVCIGQGDIELQSHGRELRIHLQGGLWATERLGKFGRLVRESLRNT